MTKKYVVRLAGDERTRLEQMIRSGKAAARQLTHARILLKADIGPQGEGWLDQEISDALDVGVATVARVRQRCVEEGLEAALKPRPQQRRVPRKLDGRQEAKLVTLACSDPPAGHARWTLRLLAERLVELDVVESISYETVRQTLKKTISGPG